MLCGTFGHFLKIKEADETQTRPERLHAATARTESRFHIGMSASRLLISEALSDEIFELPEFGVPYSGRSCLPK